MGQHKHNPTAIAAKNKEIPPKEQKNGLSRREYKKALRELIKSKVNEIAGYPDLHIPIKYL